MVMLLLHGDDGLVSVEQSCLSFLLVPVSANSLGVWKLLQIFSAALNCKQLSK